MIKALLLDLDDTLLENPMSRFLPAYLDRLGAFLADVAPREKVVHELMEGTTRMIANRDPTATLQDVFDGYFYPHLGVSASDLEEPIEQFYTQVFPELRSLTRPMPFAREIIRSALEHGLEVAIATNPLFPRLAVEERMRWAGLHPEQDGFALVSSFETFHFSKPSPAYFAELLGRLGYMPHEAAMAGDDEQLDLQSARALGMATFHVAERPAPGYSGGDLQALANWLEGAQEETEPERYRGREVILARLEGNLAALCSISRSIAAEVWQRRPAPQEWAPAEIISHLRDVEREVNLVRLEAILGGDRPHLSAPDTDRWASERAYLKQDGLRAMSDLCELRKSLVERLRGISEEEWHLPALHTLFGPTDLAEVMSIAAEHDIVHLAQLRTALRAP